MAVTIKEVAMKAGVSYTVVSKVLNSSKSTVRVSEKTRARVAAAAAAMGYRPNSQAQSIRRGRSANVAFLIPDNPHAGFAPPGLIPELALALSQRDMHLTVARLPDQKLMDSGFVPKILRELAVDGLLINYVAGIPPRIIELIQHYKIPSIWLNAKLDVNCVYPDDYDAAVRATRRLLELGHRRIAYVHMGSMGHYSTIDRQAGYEAVMREAGLTPRVLSREYVPYSVRETPEGDIRRAAAEELLQGEDRPTAIVAYEEGEALPILAVAERLRMKVPRDLSLTTFHYDVVDGSGLPLTTLRHGTESLAYAAVEMLCRKIEKPGIAQASRAIPYVWIEGFSCASPASPGTR